MKEAVKSGSVAVTTESSEEAVLESLAAAVGEETFAEIPSLHKCAPSTHAASLIFIFYIEVFWGEGRPSIELTNLSDS
jgi:hypothetical protein